MEAERNVARKAEDKALRQVGRWLWVLNNELDTSNLGDKEFRKMVMSYRQELKLEEKDNGNI